jgi:hypothetical protein
VIAILSSSLFKSSLFWYPRTVTAEASLLAARDSPEGGRAALRAVLCGASPIALGLLRYISTNCSGRKPPFLFV